MTLHQISLFFLGVLLVVVTAMFVHSWRDKRRIRASLLPLAARFPGQVIQESVWVYPRFEGTAFDRRFDFFFTVVKAGRQHLLYTVYSLKSSIATDLLLVKSGFYKPVAAETALSEQSGAVVAGLHAGYQARSKHPEAAAALWSRGRVGEAMRPLSQFTSLQLGPDAMVIGKTYDGLSDVSPEKIGHNVEALHRLAMAMETV